MKHRVRTIALGVGVLVVVLAVVLAMNINGSDPNVAKGRFAGKEAPAFSVTTSDGTKLALADLAGKSVLVNFWNTWCAPCIQEAPALKEFYARHKDDPDFAMVGIVRDAQVSDQEVRDYAQREGFDWTIAFDPKGKASLAYGTTGQPETFAVGPDGRVAAEQFSAASVGDLETMLRAARGTL